VVYFLLSKELGAEALSDQHGFQHPGLETALLDRLRLGHLIVCNRSNRREHGRRALSRLPYRNAIRLRDRNRERRTPVTMSASTSGLDDSAEEIAGLSSALPGSTRKAVTLCSARTFAVGETR